MTSPLQDDRYLLVEALGRGGMGSVFRAFDRIDQRMVALKVPSDPRDAGPAHPFSAEFEAWTRLRHPNIVRAYELGIARSGPLPRGTPYLVLEHAPGRPAHRVLAPGRVGASGLRCFAAQVLLALRHIHEAGLVHRDVKPDNLLTEVRANRVRRVKLTDFGLAAPCGATEEPGKISGSFSYLSPEALLGLPVDGRSDLYALGLVLFRLATGRLPASRSLEAMLRWHLSEEPADPGMLRPGFCPRLARFIRRLTARNRAERPASADEALVLLGAARGARPGGSGQEPDRGARAALRLALDATRLGARRRHVLPRGAGEAAALLREARIWARVRGVDFQRLQTGGDAGCGVAELVLRLLVDRGAGAVRLFRRYRLRRWLPLTLAGGVALRDHAERPGPAGGGIREIARFILSCSDERPIVLRLEPGPRSQPLASAVAGELRGAADPPRPPRAGSGGLLLLDG